MSHVSPSNHGSQSPGPRFFENGSRPTFVNAALKMHTCSRGLISLWAYYDGPRLRYDTIRLTILTCAQKLTSRQLSLSHGTRTKKNNEETKTKKNGDAQKKRSGREVRGVSPEAGKEFMAGRFVKEVGLEAGVKERGSYGW